MGKGLETRLGYNIGKGDYICVHTDSAITTFFKIHSFYCTHTMIIIIDSIILHDIVLIEGDNKYGQHHCNIVTTSIEKLPSLDVLIL